LIRTMDHPTRNDRAELGELRTAMAVRERASSEVRRAVAALLDHPRNVDLQGAVRVAQIREKVTRIRYAGALKAAGCQVPEDLLDDVPDYQRP
jgi:hypothetical protein